MSSENTLDSARRITTGVDVPEDEEPDEYDPENMSFIEIGEYASDPEWLARYGDRVPPEVWQRIESLIKEGIDAGTD